MRSRRPYHSSASARARPAAPRRAIDQPLLCGAPVRRRRRPFASSADIHARVTVHGAGTRATRRSRGAPALGQQRSRRGARPGGEGVPKKRDTLTKPSTDLDKPMGIRESALERIAQRINIGGLLSYDEHGA
jgi:hypothetical protein